VDPIERVQVFRAGGHGVGEKALLNGGDRITKQEAASTMADVEQYAALARRQSVGVRMHYSLEPVQPQGGRSNTEF
jgi:hypothetical protein